ncbi:carboxypeptidase-like regulatory domain-containing protein [Mucilaginibacter boryungensis]|uniref:Carboxypeptidase-like regulatory domain-containing protein n=1 Tax=Mucilaginibacter boryungensis TaxID=768480 RepID=A0ABR9XN81_9SPHI|nr:carboxypeptidase-like regulatory domain-containing protein [Mucilaginibacter boryungensis]MBE9668470.1 carboxypeptidase-like regulatory domain-containing protein [Mucilaginibacter boryungensis]
MKIKFVAAIFSVWFVLFAVYAFAQNGISITGKIKAAEDQQPLNGVSIGIDRKGTGTATNSNGQFVLIIPAANIRDTLKISSIGYQTQYLPVESLRDGQQLTISLKTNNVQLQEVTVQYHDPLKVIAKAIASIPDNYINHPHVLRGFYRMYTANGTEPLELSEAVFDVYNFGYGDKRADLFKLVKARDEKNDRDFRSLELSQKPNTIFNYDVVNHLAASGFLSEEGIKNHKFEITGIIDVKGYPAFEFQFKEKPGVEDRTYRGKFYIDTKTYAFLYFDYGLSPDGLKNSLLGNFADRILTRVAGIEVTMKRDRTKVGYQKVGDKWVLSDVVGDDNLYIKGTTTTNVNYDLTAKVKFNYQVTAVDTAPGSSFDKQLKRHESINAHDSDAGAEFWKDYNILLADQNTEDIFTHIRDVNKQVTMNAKEKK